jgi:hypothetical protein
LGQSGRAVAVAVKMAVAVAGARISVFGEGEGEGSRWFAQRAEQRANPPVSVFCFRWVSPHREDTDNAISLDGLG